MHRRKDLKKYLEKKVAGGGLKYLKNNGPTVIKVNLLFFSFHSVKCKSNSRLRWLSYRRSPGSTLSWPHIVPERKDRNVLEVWNSWLQNPLSHERSCVDDPSRGYWGPRCPEQALSMVTCHSWTSHSRPPTRPLHEQRFGERRDEPEIACNQTDPETRLPS